MKAKFLASKIMVLLTAALLLSGCATARGVASGMASDTGTAVKTTGNCGYNFWQGVLATDNWIKENLW